MGVTEYGYSEIGRETQRRQRRHVVLGLSCFALVVVVLFKNRATLGAGPRGSPVTPEAVEPHHGPWQQSSEGGFGGGVSGVDKATSVNYPQNLKVRSASYAHVTTLETYGLSLVCEPHAFNLVTWTGESGGVSWAVEGPGNASVWEAGGGTYVTCRVAGSWFTLTSTLSTAVTPNEVHCKYVRREVRALSEEDRDQWFSALSVLARASDGDALRRTYGPRATTLGELAEKHSNGPGCSPFHGGVSFFTAHAAFTQQLDVAMRAIDPELRVATPYWDFTVDGAAYGTYPYGWNASDVFDDAHFGPCRSDSKHLGGAYFSGSYRQEDCGAPLTNAPACFATDPRDGDATSQVKRSCSLCGVDAAKHLPLPGCAELATCVALVRNGTSLGDLHDCAEFVLHGNLHTVLGGSWACGADLGDALMRRPQWREVLAPFSARLLAGWQRLVRSSALAQEPGTTTWSCPAYDAARTPANARAVLAAGNYASAHYDAATRSCVVDSEFVDAAALVASLNADWSCTLSLDPAYLDDASTDDDAPQASTNLRPNAVDDDFWLLVADVACANGALGAMTTAAAPNDPIFWPMHPTFDRLLAYARLQTDAPLDETWPDGRCYGHAANDAMPFSPADFGHGEPQGDDATYTNAALYDYFDPRPTPKDHWTVDSPLDYIYDSFDYGHCAAEIEAALRGENDPTFTLSDVPAGKLSGARL